MLVKEYTGKNEKEAVKAALDELQLTEEQVRIEVLDKGKRSILGFGESTPAKIRVYYEEISTVIREIEAFIKTAIEKMGVAAEVEAREESEKRIYVTVKSEDSAILIGKKGATLEALQFLLSLVFSRAMGKQQTDYHVLLDVEGYRKRREESLRELALRMATQVKRSQHSKLLEPMNPYERRIIHLTLQEDKEIETASEGEGNVKRVRIMTKRKPGQSGGRRRYPGSRTRRGGGNSNSSGSGSGNGGRYSESRMR